MALPRAASDPLMSIGEVLTHLRDEFADITISKIRFLESHGLVSPALRRVREMPTKKTGALSMRAILSAPTKNAVSWFMKRVQCFSSSRGGVWSATSAKMRALVRRFITSTRKFLTAIGLPPKRERVSNMKRSTAATRSGL